MTYILDSSAAIEISLNRRYSSFFSDLLSSAIWVIAPDLFISEVANVFWKYHQFENLSLEICENTLNGSLNLVDDFIDTMTLYNEAFSLACMVKHPVYDMMYLVLTRRYNGTLLTLDRRLIQIANKCSIRTQSGIQGSGIK